MRVNIYRDKIMKVLKENHLLSISDIHEKVPGADYSTVYRNIEQLVSCGEVKKVVLDKDSVAYEVNDVEHKHDHFVCGDCGLVDEVERQVVDSRFLKNHVVTDVLIKGLCKECC
jgi:Fur family zinc uptake transcriptional regulator/Fur family ferric uptake transcriptional regulator